MPSLLLETLQQEKIGTLFNKQEYSDLSIQTINGKSYHVLKALLISYSPVFEEMFLKNDNNDNNATTVTEIAECLTLDKIVSDVALEMFLKIIYFGKITNYTLDNYIDLLLFANHYKMNEMEEKCALVFKQMEEERFSEENYTQLLEKIEKYNKDESHWFIEIKKSLMVMITLNFDEFKKSKDFYVMSLKDFLILLEIDIYCTSEDEVFEAAMQWIKYDYENRIQFIDEILKRIDLCDLDKVLLSNLDKHPICEKSTILPTLLLRAMKLIINPALSETFGVKKRRHTRLTLRFTTLGCTGQTIPSDLSSYKGKKYLEDVTIKNGYQFFTVPFTGKFKITACGAAGGKNTHCSNGSREGYGAKVYGEFRLTKGDVLKILVGQKGENCVGSTGGGGAGGGGGTFVVLRKGNKPLIIGAGGNGQNWASWTTNGPGGQVPVQDQEETQPTSNSLPGTRGGGGGGFKYNGPSGDSCNGGHSFMNGGKGGKMTSSSGGNGGFGGGGGCYHEGGGGGGYIGGKACPQNTYNTTYPGYGAISFNCGENQENVGDWNSADGWVEIQS
ncbi:hypothetical protein ABK040_002022 [Willaertia magna]